MMLRVEKLSKRFGKTWALSEVSFAYEGARIAVLGPNGSGKTTLLTILAGLRYPTTGRALVNGIEPYVERERAVRAISFMFEKPRFNLGIRIRDIVKILSEDRGCGDEAESLARLLGLTEFYDVKLAGLSSGQAQLVGIWASLACWDGVVIIDEPFAHLDIRRAGVLANLISRRSDIIFTTHTPEEAEALADYIVILNNGRVVWAGTRDQLVARDVFEAYPLGDKQRSLGLLEEEECRVVADLGLTVIVTGCKEEDLAGLVKRGVISGFRRAGVRYVYAGRKREEG
ncbi:ABC transporter ATP-binding protein [Desulfurococcus mucosus]|uniref:ABC transporter related protein n=1 Tax=Desulfurococcus mucosus (strain ATCC 35584 / DSM 2162 / JCM 9187 / O7/1) TaxID=765177 RepID=E8R8F1_DESM0|nr:ABC transporter ATP-binding protein [Desulfurococcus mucosus]ADV64777.1 ABC transporter related protein [Desulfurococcus mucosus DSM 2162]